MYSTEDLFNTAINGPIADLWQQREEGFIRGVDNKRIYWCKLTSPKHTKSLTVVNGRVESCFKYQELFFDLFQQGYDIYAFDHRGQGRSQRLVDDSDIGHVHVFNDYVDDMQKVVEHVNLSQYQFNGIVAHSMGGAIATRYLQQTPSHPFDAACLSAPMFGIPVPWYIKPFAISFAHVLSAVYGKPTFASRNQHYLDKPFAGNFLSQSSTRYDWFRSLYHQDSELQVGGPSYHWVWQSLIAAKQCLQQTRQLRLPVLLMQAGDDRVVVNKAHQVLFKKLRKTNPHCQLLTIEHAKHELLFESDHYRTQALDAMLQFFASHH